MQSCVRTYWRWTYSGVRSADFRSKRAAVDDLMNRYKLSYAVACFYVFSVVLPTEE